MSIFPNIVGKQNHLVAPKTEIIKVNIGYESDSDYYIGDFPEDEPKGEPWDTPDDFPYHSEPEEDEPYTGDPIDDEPFDGDPVDDYPSQVIEEF